MSLAHVPHSLLESYGRVTWEFRFELYTRSGIGFQRVEGADGVPSEETQTNVVY